MIEAGPHFSLNERVHIDTDTSIVAVVIRACFDGQWSYEAAWIVNGDQKKDWFAEWRLSTAPGEEPEPDYPKYGNLGKAGGEDGTRQDGG